MSTIKKALLVGINEYHGCELKCCINDVDDMAKTLRRNYDGSVNFKCSYLKNDKATRANIRRNLKRLFDGEGEIALFYFSGHGFNDASDGFIVSYDFVDDDYGIKMSEILELANKSKIENKIIILDCCHSGFMGNYGVVGDSAFIGNGVVILTVSKKDEYSVEFDKHGLFTNLLLESLNGGACDILGNVTPGGIYSYIENSLNAWEQRPLFKANLSSFFVIRKCEPKITLKNLIRCLDLFKSDDDDYMLDPSYEKTNFEGSEHYHIEPYCTKEHVKIFTLLQKCNHCGLILPNGSDDMYFAAMNSKSCKLSLLGRYYWQLHEKDVI